MTVRDVLAGAPVRGEIPEAVGRRTVAGVDYDSRRIAPGYLFFAFGGQRTDGRRYASQALEKGAIAVVSESPAPDSFNGPWIEVEHGRRAMSMAAAALNLATISGTILTGITGTNGKTTTAYLTDSILRAGGLTTAMVGTIEYRVGSQVRPAVNTTPESVDLYRILADLRSLGGNHATMEVSSHALALGRVHAIPFHTAVFTNLTRDHLDFHGTMEEYFAAKRLLFQGAGTAPPRWSILNADDPYAPRIAAAGTERVLWYGIETEVAPGPGGMLRASGLSCDFSGLRFDVSDGRRSRTLSSPLIGRVNVYNILAACGVGLSLELDWETIARGVAACRAVPGRFERVEEGQPFLVVVDYAHTDDALRNSIAVARDLGPGRIITLFGCGGDRDRAKRPLMGSAAASASDFVVLTSDNPRSEDPIAIMNDALVGLRRHDTPHAIEPDRAKAIRLAIAEARQGDVVILAGKGHEPYQVLKDRTIPFDDRETARAVLRSFGYSRGTP